MSEKSNTISILDCTLRDGSYLIDYQFTAVDTYIICLGMERAGFKLIEIGHGTGLGSSKAGKGKAAASDQEYLDAARSALHESDAKFGMFFIPGIGSIDDLIMAADYGMGFVRIGTNITEIEQAKPYIEKSRELGMTVSSNLMKSYAVSIDEFVRLAKMADQFGANIISVVDSAGGMFPEDVREYVLRLKDVTDRTVGFHGHNNIQLATANSIAAVKAGAGVVDSSLQGMGRSAGNAQTEVLVNVLEKMGYSTGIDPYKAMDLGERIIKPMMNREQGVDDISLVSGIAQFHSSFYQTIYDTAEKFQIDPRRLIVEVSEIDRVTVTRELAESTARMIKEKMVHGVPDRSDRPFNINTLKLKESPDPFVKAQLIADELTSQSKKTGKESVFSVTISKTGASSFPYIRQSASLVIGNVEAADLPEAEKFIKQLDGAVNWLLMDESSSLLRESGLEKNIKRSSYSWYSEERVLQLSICALLSQKRPEGTVLILADKENTDMLNLSLQRHGIPVLPWKDRKDNDSLKMLLKDTGAIISFGAAFSSDLKEKDVSLLPDHTVLYAARPHAFSTSCVDAALAQGLLICRVDSRASFAAELSLVIETKKMLAMMGSAVVSEIPVVAGGIIGQRGSIVVDSIREPSRVIGIADGSGGLLRPAEEEPFREAKEKVRQELITRLYKKDF